MTLSEMKKILAAKTQELPALDLAPYEEKVQGRQFLEARTVKTLVRPPSSRGRVIRVQPSLRFFF